VSSEFLESFGEEDNSSSFVWRNVLHQYKTRPNTLHDISLYRFCCCHWPHDKQQKPVLFFGFHDKATWPLEESYSKWILTIYYPWIDTPEELQRPTYAEFLSQNYTSLHIPFTVQANISRARNNVRSVDTSDSFLDAGGVREIFTPTRSGRVDERLNDTAEVEQLFNNNNQHDYEDLSDDQFNMIPDPIVGSVNWKQSCRFSENYDIEVSMSWLMEKRTQFYEMLETSEDANTVCQFPIEDFCPEKLRGENN
jgi:hypothetical protein